MSHHYITVFSKQIWPVLCVWVRKTWEVLGSKFFLHIFCVRSKKFTFDHGHLELLPGLLALVLQFCLDVKRNAVITNPGSWIFPVCTFSGLQYFGMCPYPAPWSPSDTVSFAILACGGVVNTHISPLDPWNTIVCFPSSAFVMFWKWPKL